MGSQRMPETVWLGLDLGTQSAPAMLVSETGDIVGIGSEKLNSQRRVSHDTLIRLALCSLFGIPLALYRAIFP